MTATRAKRTSVHRWRFIVLSLVLISLPISIIVKVAYLQILPDHEFGVDFLKHQGEIRSVRNIEIPAPRGAILDRHGKPLAISTPVIDIVGNPQKINRSDYKRLSKALNISEKKLQDRLTLYKDKSFIYLARHLSDADAEAILDLEVEGLHRETQYKLSLIHI